MSASQDVLSTVFVELVSQNEHGVHTAMAKVREHVIFRPIFCKCTFVCESRVSQDISYIVDHWFARIVDFQPFIFPGRSRSPNPQGEGALCRISPGFTITPFFFCLFVMYVSICASHRVLMASTHELLLCAPPESQKEMEFKEHAQRIAITSLLVCISIHEFIDFYFFVIRLSRDGQHILR